MPNRELLPFQPEIAFGRSPYPVWRRSQRADISYGARDIKPPKDPSAERQHLARIYRKARKWKMRNPKIMTQGTLRVLEALCFDFANAFTGKLFPSHATIAKRCGLGTTCVKEALKRLRELGILHWQRRCVQAMQALGGFILKQITNLYTILPTALWEGFVEEGDKAPPPAPHEYGGPAYTIPHGFEAATQAAVVARSTGKDAVTASTEAIKALEETAMTELERRLASFGKTIAEREAKKLLN